MALEQYASNTFSDSSPSVDPEARPDAEALASELMEICQTFSDVPAVESPGGGESLRALLSERIRCLDEDFKQQLQSMQERLHSSPRF